MSISSLGERTGYDPDEWSRSLGAPIAVTQHRKKFLSHLVRDGSIRLTYDLGKFGLHVTTYTSTMARPQAVELMEGQLALLAMEMPLERAPRPGGDGPELLEVNSGKQPVYVSRFIARRFYNAEIPLTGKVLLAPGRTVIVTGTELEMRGVALFDMYASVSAW